MSQPSDLKPVLHRHLRAQREALLWKLDGLSERDQRRPLTATGTNLLGLLKHCAYVEAGYFGEVFGRPWGEGFPWQADGASVDDNLDMYATADESAEAVIATAHRIWAHADATIDTLDLGVEGEVPWWPEGRRRATLAEVLVHVSLDLARHAGHADIIREQLDGSVGMRRTNDNIPTHDEQWWADHLARLEAIAARAERPSPGAGSPDAASPDAQPPSA